MKKKILSIIFPFIFMFIAGCNSYNVETQYDGDGKITQQTYSSVESKFTRKSVNFITEVEAIKVTTSEPTSGTFFPQVALGWFWTAFLEQDLKANGKIVFYKESKSMFNSTITGKTFLYIENNSKDTKHIKAEIKPKYFIDLPLIKVGTGDNVTKVTITDEKTK